MALPGRVRRARRSECLCGVLTMIDSPVTPTLATAPPRWYPLHAVEEDPRRRPAIEAQSGAILKRSVIAGLVRYYNSGEAHAPVVSMGGSGMIGRPHSEDATLPPVGWVEELQLDSIGNLWGLITPVRDTLRTALDQGFVSPSVYVRWYEGSALPPELVHVSLVPPGIGPLVAGLLPWDQAARIYDAARAAEGADHEPHGSDRSGAGSAVAA